MPLVSHPNLPSLERLESSELVIKEDDSKSESFSRHLHIGFLNLMPDAAFQATERQFVSMLASDGELLVHLYPRELAVWEDVFGGDLVRLADGHHLIRKVFVGDIAISIFVKSFEE